MSEMIKSALTPEEWSAIREPSNVTGSLELDYSVRGPDGTVLDRHRRLDLAAMLAYANALLPDGDPLKFTAEDVALLRRSFDLSNDVWRMPDEERAASLVARIAALLPPETP